MYRNKLYRVAQKECNTYDQEFQENEGENEKVVCIDAYRFYFPSKMAPRSLILMKAFWICVCFSEAMSISKFATSVSKVTIDVPQISIVWLPRVKYLLLLWKTKTAWIKRCIHYVTLQCYNPGEATQRNSSRPQSWLLIEKQIFKMTLAQKKMALESKRLHQKDWSWCHFVGKRIFYALMHSLIWFSPWFLWNEWS